MTVEAQAVESVGASVSHHPDSFAFTDPLAGVSDERFGRIFCTRGSGGAGKSK